MNTFVDYILSLNPLVGAGYVLLSCYGGMYGIAWLIERRWLDPAKQYLAFIAGNGVLAAAAGSALFINHAVGYPLYTHWIYDWWWHVIAVIAFGGFGVWRWAFNDYPAYSVGQMASPTKLYHDTLFLAEGYFLFVLIGVLVGRTWLIAVPLAFIGLWAYLGIFLDGKRPDKAQEGWAHIDYDWVVKRLVMQYLEPRLGRNRRVPA